MWRVTTALRSLMQNSVEDHPRLLMNQIFWARMHGGATHFPIASLMVSVVFDVAGFWWRTEHGRREFRAFGFYSLLIAAAASPFAVLSGIALSKGKLMGSGDLLLHHLFIWPAFGLLVGLAAWRLVMRGNASRRASGCYLVLVMITAAAMMGAGYWGGEMLIGK
jgi:uncharacterized membrane protein